MGITGQAAQAQATTKQRDMIQTELTWSEGIKISAKEQKQIKVTHAEKINEFLTSKCDLFTFADWQYYANETGKPISWLMENASYSDRQGAYGTMLENAIEFGDSEMAELFI